MRLEIRRLVNGTIPVKRLEEILKKALRVFKQKPEFSALSLVMVSDRAIAKLNERYRGKKGATDVLSFAYGEIIISYPTARRQAKEHGRSVAQELQLLFTHGLLHILGFDHRTKKDRLAMSRAEERILGYSGLIEIQNSKCKT